MVFCEKKKLLIYSQSIEFLRNSSVEFVSNSIHFEGLFNFILTYIQYTASSNLINSLLWERKYDISRFFILFIFHFQQKDSPTQNKN